MCVPSFKSMNCIFLYRKKYDGNIFTTIPCQVLRDQNVSVGIVLIQLTEPSDTLNCKPFFNHCILQTILHIFLLLLFLWNIIFCFKNWALFYIFLILLQMVVSVTVLKILWFWFFLQGYREFIVCTPHPPIQPPPPPFLLLEGGEG